MLCFVEYLMSHNTSDTILRDGNIFPFKKYGRPIFSLYTRTVNVVNLFIIIIIIIIIIIETVGD